MTKRTAKQTTTRYATRNDIKAGDRVQHPDGRIGVVQHDPGWAVFIKMENESKPELWQIPYVVINFALLSRS